jgi:peroxin-5
MGRDREELDQDYSTAMQEAWNGGFGNLNESALESKYNDDGTPILTAYVFGESDPTNDALVCSTIQNQTTNTLTRLRLVGHH